MPEAKLLLDGLHFPEGPRWHAGRLWFSDMHGHHVVAVDLTGRAERILHLPTWPSGLGWLPDGRLLVVSMTDRRLMRLEKDGRLAVHAELSHLAPFHCNDMVVDAAGRAYVGNFGFDLMAGETPITTCLIRVDPDGTTSIAAENVFFPNGAVITADNHTLILAETFGRKLTAFDIGADGVLSNYRLWADLSGNVPDGICLDAEGAVWVACPPNNKTIRVHEGGAVMQVIDCDRGAYACMLGGPEGRHLFIAASVQSRPELCRAEATGQIQVLEVDVPRAGLP
jgi:sugar lactone lactonase YvrE